MSMVVTPVTRSPAIRQRWMGASPLHAGSRLPWPFTQPRRGTASSSGVRIRP